MSTPLRRAVAALTAVALAALAAACARIPTESEVRDGAADIEMGRDVDYIPVGPAAGAGPEQIVQGFLNAAVVGPMSTTSYAVAQEYLTPSAGSRWERYARVLVLQENPRLTVGEVDETTTTTIVRAEGLVVASVDERGVYSEQASPSTVEVAFALSRGADGQWRISQLEDGLLISTSLFTQAFHLTRLYFPTPDLTSLVPEVRWYPRQTWRTDATAAILEGPPEWLQQSTRTVIPDGTTLAIDAVTVDEDGTIEVPLTSAISEATVDQRALVVAQLEATLVEADGRTVALFDGAAPLAVPSTASLALPRTSGGAVALAHDRLHSVVGRRLEVFEEAVPLGALAPTALAVEPGDGRVVVRDDDRRLVRVTGADAPVTLLTGEGLVPPSIDRFGAVWSGTGGGIEVVLPSSRVVPVAAEWLAGRTIRTVRVSPEGARVAVVSDGPGGRQVHVAGVVRDAQNAPTGLSAPVTVGATIDDVSDVSWQDVAALAVVGSDDGVPAVFLTGVGGLASQGGVSRVLAGVVDPRSVAAAVGSGAILAVDADGTLLSRQTAALWSTVDEDVRLVAYPG